MVRLRGKRRSSGRDGGSTYAHRNIHTHTLADIHPHINTHTSLKHPGLNRTYAHTH